MREILFRGKHFDNKDWVYGNLMLTKPMMFTECLTMIGTPDAIVFVDPETVGQYTGLTDRSGNKIFEGDIVSLNGKSACKIAFAGGAFNAGTAYGEHIPLDDRFYLSLMEVVGNIFDNPELMEVSP